MPINFQEYGPDGEPVAAWTAHEDGHNELSMEILTYPAEESQRRVLKQMMERVFRRNKAKGFTGNTNFVEYIALLHSEVSEALEAYRDHELEGPIYRYSSPEGYVYSEERVNRDGVRGKPIHAASELADVLIRLLDTCQVFGIDISKEFNDKMEYNWTRQPRHGGKRL